jgi:hypothetical protein
MANYVLLERIELNASAASVTFANIPQTGYTDLKVVISSRQSVSEASGGYYYDVTFNGTSANRSGLFLRNHNGTVTSAAYTLWGLSNPSDYTANTFSSCELYIPNYTSSNFKSASLDSVNENNATGIRQVLATGLWSNTAAITSVTLTPGAGTFDANSTFSLYGIAAVGTTPAIAPKASGGNRIDYDGTYWIHTFNTNGTFTPQTALTCDYLVVAGGGGGGYAGGGAGGFRTATGFAVTTTPYSITVGAGGTFGANLTVNPGTSGNDSVFSSITSAGGGGGGGANSSPNWDGKNGGSGGGAGYSNGATVPPAGTGNTPSTSPAQGTNGGTTPASNQGQGGGGGASTAGGNGTSTASGAGGAGTASSISGTSVTYAGGGGGGATNKPTTSGAGGAGGGGAGGTQTPNTNGTSGTVNTGGGGGGGNAQGAPNAGGTGGSGIVIIRYLA